MGKLFGTDGVRGVANIELTCRLAWSIGKAAAQVLAAAGESGRKPRVIIGKDTRISGDMLENALAAGFNSVGADVELIGVVPTPAVAYLVKEMDADAGAMISASHNPYEYNGIKLFNREGYKLADEVEEKIEALIRGEAEEAALSADRIGRTRRNRDAVEKYIEHITGTVDGDLSGIRLAVDCANGSASVTAGEIFRRLGADVIIMGADPDGFNINDKCGSTHLGALSDKVKELKLDAGLAFDGDADRFLAVDENGETIDGDKLIAVFAAELKKKGRLPGNTAVVTSMTNMGFYDFAEKNGIRVSVTGVGDRYVLEEMLNHGYGIGGEQSGHIIFREYATTGDGQLSAVQFVSALISSGKKASEFAAVMEKYPQIMLNIRADAGQKAAFAGSAAVAAAVADAEKRLGSSGRIVVRPSGTEPLIRVMLEGRDRGFISEIGEEICDIICSETGASR